MSDANGLIERLEAGETGREIDAAIYAALFNAEVHKQEYCEGDGAAEKTVWLMTGLREADGRYVVGGACRYTTSLDAAVALVERVKPGQQWQVNGNSWDKKCWGIIYGETNGDDTLDAYAPTPAAALVAALLRGG